MIRLCWMLELHVLTGGTMLVLIHSGLSEGTAKGSKGAGKKAA